MNWTTPYHGVQHLRGLPKRWQITVVDYATFAEVTVFDLYSDTPFTGGGVANEFFSKLNAPAPLEQAIAWAEKKAKELL
jgi:hypothetical protein